MKSWSRTGELIFSSFTIGSTKKYNEAYFEILIQSSFPNI